jgi:mono/diheme cytochrome c family protein
LRRALLALLAVAVAGAVVFYFLTMPPATEPVPALPAHTPDLANGKYMFTAGGCAECHAVPVKNATISKPKTR